MKNRLVLSTLTSLALFASLSSVSMDKTAKGFRLVKVHSYEQEARFQILELLSPRGQTLTIRTPVGNREILKHLQQEPSAARNFHYAINEEYQPIPVERDAFQRHMPCQQNGPVVTCRDRVLLKVDFANN